MDPPPEETVLRLPPHLPFPITITRLLSPSSAITGPSTSHRPTAQIDKHAPLLSYQWTVPARKATVTRRVGGMDIQVVEETEERRENGVWESPVEGTISTWHVREGDVVRSASQPIVSVIEPCTHPVQLGGMCAVCGQDVSGSDYTGFSSQASISMTHDSAGVTVNLAEARRLENETTSRLLASRKLSLIVDLDQTIVHATVDPTVGEWMEDPNNPNYEALKGVGKFRLGMDGTAIVEPTDEEKEGEAEKGQEGAEAEGGEEKKDEEKQGDGEKEENAEAQGEVGKVKGKQKEKKKDEGGCWYYVKMRPGLLDFLERMSEIFEMHVYTMGTRSYATSVCNIVDPDGKFFGNRILSRDESGSLTQKSLKRLFPVDTSMVVIIDDRADVWGWSPNLVRVLPYDFFVGIGDINATFLPNGQTSAHMILPGASSDEGEKKTEAEGDGEDGEDEGTDGKGDAGKTRTEEVEGSDTSSTSTDVSTDQVTAALKRSQTLALSEQRDARPLAKMQEELDASLNGSDADVADGEGSSSELKGDSSEAELERMEEGERVTGASREEKAKGEGEGPKPKENAKKGYSLLRDDDEELKRLEQILSNIHGLWYEAYASMEKTTGPKPDVKEVIPSMQRRVLEGIHILFSGVVPLGTDAQASQYWIEAQRFGAICEMDWSSKVTHVVATKRGTSKVNQALTRPSVRVVWLSWLTGSMAAWRRLPEREYLIDPEMSNDEFDSSDDCAEAEAMDKTGAREGPDEEGRWVDGEPPWRSQDMAGMDWLDAAREVDEFLNESGDDDTDGDDGYGSATLGGTGSAPSTPRSGKRSRPRTPSDDGRRSANASDDERDDMTRSPLSKRKKLAEARSGRSPLKLSFSLTSASGGGAEDVSGNATSSPTPSGADSVTSSRKGAGGEETAQGVEEDDDDDDDDGFLDDLAHDLEADFE